MAADIETETRANVLTVPIQSVTVRAPKKEMKEEPKEGEAQLIAGKKKEEDKLEEVVFVVKDGAVKTVPVKRGISNDTYVESKGRWDSRAKKLCRDRSRLSIATWKWIQK